MLAITHRYRELAATGAAENRRPYQNGLSLGSHSMKATRWAAEPAQGAQPRQSSLPVTDGLLELHEASGC